MNQHKRVVREVLNFLYGRIPVPFATDQERHRIALVALDALAPDDAPTFDLGGLTVAQVQTAVEGGKVSTAVALEYELKNSNRKSLIAWLKERE